MNATPKTDRFEWSMGNKQLTEREKEILDYARSLELRFSHMFNDINITWSFDPYQQHTHSWQDKADFIERWAK